MVTVDCLRPWRSRAKAADAVADMHMDHGPAITDRRAEGTAVWSNPFITPVGKKEMMMDSATLNTSAHESSSWGMASEDVFDTQVIAWEEEGEKVNAAAEGSSGRQQTRRGFGSKSRRHRSSKGTRTRRVRV